MSAVGKRVVLTTFGSLGDLHPYLALAIELKARGQRPLIATHPNFGARVLAEGVDFHPVRPDVGAFGDEAALMKRVMQAQDGPRFIIRDMFMPHLRDSYADLLVAAGGADLLLTHSLTFAGPLVAQKLGIPWVSTALAPTAFFSAWDPPILAPVPFLNQLRVFGPGFYGGLLALMKKSCASWTREVHELRREIGLPPSSLDPMFAGQWSPLGTLALYSPVMGAPQPDWPPRTHLTGFPFYDPGDGASPPNPELQEFLADGPPPIVFTLGSSAVMDAGDFFTESARAAQLLGHRAVLLTGRDPRNRPTAPLSKEILALDYAPYTELFERGAATVHQAGIGTTAQALRAGHPMLILPYAFDQPDNAARVLRLGVARIIPRGHYKAKRVARDLGTMLEDPEVLERAAVLRRQIEEERGVSKACDLIEGWL